GRAHRPLHGRLHDQQVGAPRPHAHVRDRARASRHPREHRPSRIHPHRDDRERAVRLPRRERAGRPAAARRRARRGREPRGLPAVGCRVVHHRRRDRRRRRPVSLRRRHLPLRRRPSRDLIGVTMYMYFPTNYVWSMSVVATLNNGGLIDDVDKACRPVLEASTQGDDVGTELLYASWQAVADRLLASAQEDEARGWNLGAAEKYYRAMLYTSQAERLQSPLWEGRRVAYQKSIDLLLKHVELAGVPVTTVDIPYTGDDAPEGA